MKLSGDILYDHLKDLYKVKRYGTRSERLVLCRPLLYTGADNEFLSGRVYVAFSDQLPGDPVLKSESVLVCVGGNPATRYLTGCADCIVVSGQSDLFTIFNQIQEIYDKFDRWELALQDILDTDAEVNRILEASAPIFENPISVIGSDYQFLGYSKIIDELDSLKIYRPDENNRLPFESFSNSITGVDSNMALTTPFCLKVNGKEHLVSNLFENGVYIGCLKVACVLRPYRTSDNLLAQYLAHILEKAIPRLSNLSYSSVDIRRDMFKKLLLGAPLEVTRRQQLTLVNETEEYLAMKIVRSQRVKKKVPAVYLCEYLESAFPGSVAFEYQSAIALFVVVREQNGGIEKVRSILSDTLKPMQLRAGVSNRFSNLALARLHYQQACIAMEFGTFRRPNYVYYLFSDYVLRYMMYSCMGEFPSTLLFTEGFRRLEEYNRQASADYLETLQIYLNNNMNVTKTAEDLMIHRSTLLERLKRIEKLLESDLKDPDERLCLSIILKIDQIQRKDAREEYKEKFPEPAEMTDSRQHNYEYRELEKQI
ncbi:MAG: helix-turn-helix domain-containing protein [Eubacteriales bacterium]|nr:helix-turn-helix domain-containing protein [Eubacteriales bacterium]